MLFYMFITCLVMAGAVDIFNITGAVGITDSAFIDNEAILSAGRIILTMIMIMIMIHMYLLTCVPTL